MTDPASNLHLAVALEGAAWHPAAWREDDARPRDPLTAGYLRDLVVRAEAGLVDFVTIEDALRLQSDDYVGPDDRIDQVRGRLDAVLIAARVAPLTRHVGLVPTATVTHTEPFHLSKAIATVEDAGREFAAASADAIFNRYSQLDAAEPVASAERVAS